MVRKISLAAVFILSISTGFFCKDQNHLKEKMDSPSIIEQERDSVSHANGRKLFGLYCRTCHRLSKNQPLLGTSKNITLEHFYDYVLKDSATKANKSHIKFETLTKKDVSDIKYYLDKG